MPSRADFIAQARKYLGTPHRHQGRAHLGGKNQALDCVGLLVCAAEDLGLKDKNGQPIRRADNLNYGPQPSRDDVHQECKRRMELKTEAPPHGKGIAIVPAPGDVITLRVRYRDSDPGVTCHVAIVTDLGRGQVGGAGEAPILGMIHAHATIGRVAEHALSPKWVRRIEGIFSIPELDRSPRLD